MTPVPSISITTPDLESEDLANNSEAVTYESPPEPQANAEESAETIAEETLNPKSCDNHVDMVILDDKNRTIYSFYENKSILLTGGTGFVGKAVLWKLLYSLGESLDTIFILLRPTRINSSSADKRLKDDILSNKAFTSLRGSMGIKRFDTLIKEKVRPIFGDLTEPNLGLCDESTELIKKKVNVIFNCAGNSDGNEILENTIKINTLGTLDLLNLAKQCDSISGFVHLSTLQPNSDERYLYPLKQDHSATDVLQDILDQQELVEYKPLYDNAYLYAKSMTEHILADQVNKMPKEQLFPISIMRLGPVGPSVQEPLIGWADGVHGVNGIILLTGKGSKAIHPQLGDTVADIVPVDYAARLIIGCPTVMYVPHDFQVPALQPTEEQKPVGRKRSSSQASRISIRSSHFQPQRISDLPTIRSLPVIYQISMSHKRPLTWQYGYETIRQYWNKATQANLPSSGVYFTQRNSGNVSPTPSVSRARTVMNSIRGYYNSPNAEPISVSPSVSTEHNKRSSHRVSRTVDKAIKLSGNNSLYHENFTSNQHANALTVSLRHLDDSQKFDPSVIVPEDADRTFWFNYITNASYGIHYFICQESNHIRLPTPIYGWNCAIQLCQLMEEESGGYTVVQRQVRSALFTQDEIIQRMLRMVQTTKLTVLQNKYDTNKGDEVWLADLDDSLDDWCQDNEINITDRRMSLGKWRKKVGSNDESVKVAVLNDKRVNLAISQITQKAGVPKQTAVNEAVKILMRMSERTQLAFVWFTGSFLRHFFEDMFENVRIQEESLRIIRQSAMGKRVVYIPSSKSILDQLLVWYIAIRYHLPVPALACDESMSQMGPISDIYRLAGAYYIKRDKTKRSPLNSAVTAAYTQVLLKEHGALSFYLERSRSRTGKCQNAYPDGLVDMVIEATLQTNQIRASSSGRDSTSPPDSPNTVDSTPPNTNQSKKVQKDILFVPVNITYENVPELPYLVDEVLDQQQPTTTQHRRTPSNASPTPSRIVRPSEAKDKRKTVSELPSKRKYGRVIFGVGPLVSVQEVADQCSSNQENELVTKVTKKIQESQRKGLVISIVSVVSSIILYGRATHGVCVGKIKEIVNSIRHKIVQDGHMAGWEEGEDLDLLITASFKLLDESKNIVMEGKEMNDDTNIRVNNHADNVMILSYYANQMLDVFLLDSFFAVVYLSFSDIKITEDDFMDRFRFLVQLLEREFVLDWNVEEKFQSAIQSNIQKKVIKKQDQGLVLLVNMESEPTIYEHLMYLASLVYPTIDAYWITSCSLSALEAVPMLPRCIVPLLTQWIATHLITGRRTIYREVLSTEPSKMAVDVFMSMGFLTEIMSKEKLSPDAQILLHEFGIPTSEVLIELSGQNSDGGKTPVSPIDPEGMMKAVMAQIEMNRANSNMVDLCQQIDSYRLGAASQRESFQNAQVFQKCLKQIRGILNANVISIVKKRNVDLPEDEANLAQLIYSLLASGAPSGDRTAQAHAFRRISEAYNLR
ncbi:male sterility protein-domain-containing protein [Sporodiniella umbellata]|nr:male sterility protein-domain-containing protein [Sporodiniella umbellata]